MQFLQTPHSIIIVSYYHAGLYDKDYLKKLGIWEEKEKEEEDEKKGGKKKESKNKAKKRTLPGIFPNFRIFSSTKKLILKSNI